MSVARAQLEIDSHEFIQWLAFIDLEIAANNGDEDIDIEDDDGRGLQDFIHSSNAHIAPTQ